MDSYLPRCTLLICFLFSLFHIIESERVIYNSQEIKDLFNIDPDFYPNPSLWIQTHTTTTAKTFHCVGLTFYGGTDVFGVANDYLYIGYGTPLSHNVIYYTLTFSLGGTWGPTDGFNLYFVGSTTEVATWQVGGAYATTICYFNDIKIKGKISHSAGTLYFYVQNLQNPTATFGFRKISIRLATDTAPTASEKLCFSSNTFQALGWGVSSQCTCGTAYYYTGTVCAACDASCEECFGPGAGNCYTCNFGYYHNGIQCVACTYDCTDCDTCNICSGLDYYMNNQCVPTCNLPFLAVISGDRRLCLSPCKDTEVIYADGTCQSTCVSPYHLVAVYNQQVCSSPCPGGYTVYYNGTCSPYACPYPLFNKLISGSGYICKYPCNYPSEIYYKNNGTCSSSCNFPYVTRTYGLFTACEPPCTSGYYRYWDGPTGSCQTCPSLLQPRALSGVWLCDPPQCGKILCSACGVGNTCNSYYYCNTTYGAFCMPYYKYTLEAKEVRPLINGVTLYVQVVPVAGILDSEDILTYQIYGLELGVDYTVTITKISKGNYQLNVVILQSIGQTSPVAGFGYAPYTLGITLDYTLPRLTFISEEVQSSSRSTSKGSQIAFLIFLVSIIGSILSGGLASVWTAMPESQYSYYLLYLNVDFLAQTQEYFESLSNYDILLSGSGNNDDLDLSYQDVLPRQFYFKNYTPDFIGNTDQLFLQALISFSVLGISTLILKYVRFSGRGILIMKGIGYIRKSLKWNLLIRQVLTYSLPVCIASFIQIYSIIFGYTIYLSSVILAVATLVGFVLCFRYMLSLINNIPKGKHEKNIYSQNYGTLWEDLDVSLFSRYYYWLVALRGCLLAYMTVFFSVYPYVQIITLTVYQCLIVGLFVGKFKLRKVFSESALNTVTFIEESCLLMVKIFIFVFIIMESRAGDSTLILVGWLIIIPAGAAQFLQIFYSIESSIDIGKLLRTYEMIKAKVTGKKPKKIRRKMRRILKNVKIVELPKA